MIALIFRVIGELTGAFSYEGTGRSLSLKLIKQLRENSATGNAGGFYHRKNVCTKLINMR